MDDDTMTIITDIIINRRDSKRTIFSFSFSYSIQAINCNCSHIFNTILLGIMMIERRISYAAFILHALYLFTVTLTLQTGVTHAQVQTIDQTGPKIIIDRDASTVRDVKTPSRLARYFSQVLLYESNRNILTILILTNTFLV
jgi:hypothetical protein